LAFVFGVAAAPTPAERLPDPSQEARARALFREIRCVVCQNENIDDSEAELASDLRRLVREDVAAGRSDREVLDRLTDRYGEFIRFRPTWSGANLLLWLGPLLVLLAGGLGLARLLRGRTAPVDSLTPDEERRLREIVTPPRV
jgi:cytochrome c-type biogenesis protein CcmH